MDDADKALPSEDPLKVEGLLPLVYDELRQIARSKLSRRPPGVTLQTTAVVHEAWLKVAGQDPDREIGREHFLALAATAMRQVLANHAESRAAAKRGGGWDKVTLSDPAGPVGASEGVDWIAISEALEQLWQLNDRHGRLAELRILSGMTIAECAATMDLSIPTIEREWRTVRAWFSVRLAEAD